MEKLDLKDRKILYHLDLDSRQSFRSIGKKIGLSKDVIANRVKKLQEKGVIKHFYTQVDPFKLGYICFRFYIIYRDSYIILVLVVKNFYLLEVIRNLAHYIFDLISPGFSPGAPEITFLIISNNFWALHSTFDNYGRDILIFIKIFCCFGTTIRAPGALRVGIR